MMNRATRNPGNQKRRLRPTPSIVLAVAALYQRPDGPPHGGPVHQRCRPDGPNRQIRRPGEDAALSPGAGDTVECQLKSAGTTIDQIAMKTLPALAAIPASMQAVATVASPFPLSVQCKVKTADGAANFNSLIAIPTG
jgi:hypothetical protein